MLKKRICTWGAIILMCFAVLTMPACGQPFLGSSTSGESPSTVSGPLTTQQFTQHNEVLKNPLIGFAPNAQYPDSVGDSTLVYVGLTWKDWEPEKGRYDTARVEQLFSMNRWRQENRRLVFRFICDYPTEEKHLDIPEWLYEETGDGAWYSTSYGKGYSPNYANGYLIERHRLAMEALGAYLGKDSFVAYVQLGSVGHWGEWHVNIYEGLPPLPGEEIISAYVLPYLSAFPNSKLMMRRPFSWVSEYGMGVYNDMAGHKADTLKWLNWIAEGGVYDAPLEDWPIVAVPEVWNRAPIGGEFTNYISLETMLGPSLPETLSLLSQSHMTFIGPKIPRTGGNQDITDSAVNAVLNTLGYRFIFSEATIDSSVSGQISVGLGWENVGAAPLYWDWPVYIYLLGADGVILQKQQVDFALTSLLPGGAASTTTQLTLEQSLPAGTKIGVGIEDPVTGRPCIAFGITCEVLDGITVIATI